LTGAPAGDAAASLTAALRTAFGSSAEPFSRVFYVAAACFAVTLVCMLLLEERPLKSSNSDAAD
jgi:hypothetical protein